jgi:Xaa-Pro dipeptidase
MIHDYSSRMDALKKKVKELSLEVYLVTDRDSIYYLTGASYKPLERPFFIIVRPEGETDLLVPELEREHMRKAEGFGEVKSYFDYPSVHGENWFDKLNAMLKGVRTIGIEPTLPIDLAKELAKYTVVSLGLVDELRLVKSEEEIACIRNAAAYADKGMERLVKSLYAGVSVVELFSIGRGIQTDIIKTGEFDPINSEFLTVGWPAPQSSQPHSIPGLSDRLNNGPLSLMSFLRINGYAAECERTAFIGAPTEAEREFYNHMLKAREAAFALIKPGASCSEIDLATKDYFGQHELSQYILHRTGHGIGLGNHEAPWVSAGSKDKLEKNMVISVEPAIYVPEVGGFRHSDTVLVTEDGYECLTKYPTDIAALTLKKGNAVQAFKGGLIRGAVGIK